MKTSLNLPPNLPALKAGWSWVKLGDIAKSEKGKKPKNLTKQKDEKNSIPYINIKAFENRGIDNFTDGENCRFCGPDDVLVVWDGARCGLPGRGIKGAIGSTLAKIKSESHIDSFIFYFLQQHYKLINTNPKGVGIPHIEPNLFWGLDIPLPPLSEQKKIVKKIEKLFTELEGGVTSLKKAKEQIKLYRQSVLSAAFSGRLGRDESRLVPTEEQTGNDLLRDRQAVGGNEHLPYKQGVKKIAEPDVPYTAQLPTDWKWVKLGEVCEKIVGGGTPSTKVEKYWNGNINWITSADIYGLRDIRPRKKITKEAIENSATNLVPKGTIIVVTRVSLGRLAIVEHDMCFSQDSQGLILKKEIVDKNYVLWFLSSATQIFKYKNRGTTIKGVTKKQLADLEFILPPKDQQTQIVSEIEKRFSKADKIEKVIDESLKKSETLRQSILKKAFEGKLI